MSPKDISNSYVVILKDFSFSLQNSNKHVVPNKPMLAGIFFLDKLACGHGN